MSSKVVTFVYDGGSNPGKVRTVLVNAEYAGGIEGIDLDKDETRKFSTSKMRCQIEFDTLVLTGDSSVHVDLESLLQSKGYKVRISGNSVIGFKPIGTKMNGWLRVGRGNKTVDIKGGYGGRMLIVTNGIGTNADASLNDIIAALQSVK